MGPLLEAWCPGQMCRNANSFLIGMGPLEIKLNRATGKQIGGITHGYVEEIKNNNDSPVITNYFGDKENSIISAVIISTAYVNNRYSKDNTVIFKNPFAEKQVDISKFGEIPYWEIGDNDEYIPKIAGERVELNYNMF